MPAPPTPPLPPCDAGAAELTPEVQAVMVRALHAALQARQASGSVALIETHISYVLVGAGQAYKFKKALRPGFLDYSTLELRRHCCDEELRLNRRLAPRLYVGVVAVTGTPAAPVLGGPGPAIDCAVHMRAFDPHWLWDRLAARGELQPAHIDELVALLCRFHAGAAVADAAAGLGTPAQVRAPMRENLQTLPGLLERPAEGAALQRLAAWEARAYATLEPTFAERLAQGRVRECHGDLHLGNVTLIDGRTTVFDGIEFNDEFRWIDVVSELAFMAMDLHAHGLHALAHRLVDGWLQGSGDYDGARVLRYYLVHRALVRAKVAALRARQEGADAPADACTASHYVELALQCSQEGRPALLITHGYSGSGKTTGTQGLLEAAGAVRIRADVERKRLAGLQALARSASPLHGGLYGPEMTAATYERMLQLAVPVLQGGIPVILDATFLQRAQRDAARRFAAAQGVPWRIVDFTADEPTLRDRLRRRRAAGNDASEADERVLELQLRGSEPLQGDEVEAILPCPAAGAGAAAPVSAVDWTPLLAALALPNGRPAAGLASTQCAPAAARAQSIPDTPRRPV